MTAEIVGGFNPVQISCARNHSSSYLLYIGKEKRLLSITVLLIGSQFHFLLQTPNLYLSAVFTNEGIWEPDYIIVECFMKRRGWFGVIH